MNQLAMIRLRRETHNKLKDEAKNHGYKEWCLADRILTDYFEKLKA